MPDTVTDTQTTEKVIVQSLVADAIDSEKAAVQVVEALKSGGIPAVAKLLSTLIPTIKKDVSDVELALPVIKSGYKTTEFWAIVGGCLVAGVLGLDGKDTPFQTVEAIMGMVSAYAVSRGVAKKGNQ